MDYYTGAGGDAEVPNMGFRRGLISILRSVVVLVYLLLMICFSGRQESSGLAVLVRLSLPEPA